MNHAEKILRLQNKLNALEVLLEQETSRLKHQTEETRRQIVHLHQLLLDHFGRPAHASHQGRTDHTPVDQLIQVDPQKTLPFCHQAIEELALRTVKNRSKINQLIQLLPCIRDDDPLSTARPTADSHQPEDTAKQKWMIESLTRVHARIDNLQQSLPCLTSGAETPKRCKHLTPPPC